MGHGYKDCDAWKDVISDLREDDFPYSLALKVESFLVGKESLQFGFADRNPCISLRMSDTMDRLRISLL